METGTRLKMKTEKYFENINKSYEDDLLKETLGEIGTNIITEEQPFGAKLLSVFEGICQ